ncbi:MAG: hypothetical protein AAFO07_05030 [Bacteroidota bacterium]
MRVLKLFMALMIFSLSFVQFVEAQTDPAPYFKQAAEISNP